jgi:hypothetical protein
VIACLPLLNRHRRLPHLRRQRYLAWRRGLTWRSGSRPWHWLGGLALALLVATVVGHGCHSGDHDDELRKQLSVNRRTFFGWVTPPPDPHSLRGGQCPLDPTTAEDPAALVEGDGLAGRDR